MSLLMVAEYLCVCDENVEDLNAKISALLSSDWGWEPVGGVALINGVVCQAMVRREVVEV